MYFFAYGSLMKQNEMKRECPGSRFLYSAKLKDYKFVYDGYSSKWCGPVANIVELPENVVMGALYQVPEREIEALDRREGCPCVYQKKEVEVESEQGAAYEAIVYYRKGEKEGEPQDKYKQLVIEGARDCGLDEDYIQRVLDI